jgi:sigma-E factor negative regulatory protein RseC
VIEENAQVIETEGEFAWVETRRQAGCGVCGASRGCGTASLARLFGQREPHVRALNPVGARPGDEVIVGIEESALVSGSLLMYIAPLLLLLACAGAGRALGSDLAPAHAEALSILAGLSGMAFGFRWVRRLGTRIARDSRYQPVILRCSRRVFPFR